MACGAKDSSGDTNATVMTEHWTACGTSQAVPKPHSLPPAAQTRFVEEPEDQTVVAGQRIVLSCVVLNYSGIVQWTKDGLALGMGQGLKGAWGELGAGDGTAKEALGIGAPIAIFPRIRCSALLLPLCTRILVWPGP